jgi:hypothetical protein
MGVPSHAGPGWRNIAENRFDFWLLTMASDLDDRELWTLVNTLREVRERIAHALDHA